MFARIPIWFLFSILTCCCDKGEEVPDENDYAEHVISFDYISNALEERNYFRNHAIGRGERDFNVSLGAVR